METTIRGSIAVTENPCPMRLPAMQRVKFDRLVPYPGWRWRHDASADVWYHEKIEYRFGWLGRMLGIQK